MTNTQIIELINTKFTFGPLPYTVEGETHNYVDYLDNDISVINCGTKNDAIKISNRILKLLEKAGGIIDKTFKFTPKVHFGEITHILVIEDYIIDFEDEDKVTWAIKLITI